MRKEEFRSWLEEKRVKRSAGDCVSRCGKVEKAFKVDLDDEFLHDGGKTVMEKLKYSVQDERDQIEPPEGINFKEHANIRRGMTDLRSSVNRYFVFCEEKFLDRN